MLIGIDSSFLNSDRLESDMHHELSCVFDPETYELIHDRMYDLLWDQITEETWSAVYEAVWKCL